MKNYLEYMPHVLREYDEIEEIANAEDNVLLEERDSVSDLISDQWIETSTERGIKRREKLLGISSSSEDDLETRRFRVLTRWNGRLPYTYKSFLEWLDALCGPEQYESALTPAEYSLHVRLELTVKSMLDDIKTVSREMIPANMLLTVDLRYNIHSDFTGFTHTALSSYTHEDMREEVVS